MATTENLLPGNNTPGPYDFTFKWLESSDIYVSVDGVAKTEGVDYNLQGLNFTTKDGGEVLFTSPIPDTSNIRIYRDTDDTATKATFYPGSAVRAEDLNSNFQQTLHVVQEVANNALLTDGSNFFVGDLDMGGFEVVNIAEPSSDTAAVNKQYVDSRLGDVDIPGHTRWTYTATGGETSLSGVGTEGLSLQYSPSREQVFLNGALLQRNTDYTADDGTTVTLLSGALIAGDLIDVRCVNNLPTGITGLAEDITYANQFTGQVSRNVASKLSDVVSVKDFGAVGDEVTDDTAAIQAMFSSGAANAVIGGDLTIRVTDTVTVASNIWIQGHLNLVIDATAAAQADSVLDIADGVTFQVDKLTITVPTGKVWSRCVTINDGSSFTVGELRLESTDQQTNYTGASNSALLCERAKLVDIEYFYCNQFDRVAWLVGVDTFKCERVEWYKFFRGLQTSSTNAYGDTTAPIKMGAGSLYIGGGIAHGDSPSVNAGDEGDNIGGNFLVLKSTEQAYIGTCYIYDTAEHGIRIASFTDPYQTTKIHLEPQYIYRPGRCGLKISDGGGGASDPEITYISVAGLYVEDAARLIDDLYAVSDVATYITKDNDFALFLDRVYNCNIGWVRTRKVGNTFNGVHGAKIRDCQSLTIQSFEAQNVAVDGIRLQNNNVDGNNIAINSGLIENANQAAGANGCGVKVFNSTKNFRHVNLNLNYASVYNAIDFSGHTAGGINQPCIFTGYWHNVSGTPFVTNYAGAGNLYFKVFEKNVNYSFYTQSGTASLEDYPVGTVIGVSYGGVSLPDFNGAVTPYRSTTAGLFTVNGNLPTTGNALEGEWRSKGILGTYVLAQRIR